MGSLQVRWASGALFALLAGGAAAAAPCNGVTVAYDKCTNSKGTHVLIVVNGGTTGGSVAVTGVKYGDSKTSVNAGQTITTTVTAVNGSTQIDVTVTGPGCVTTSSTTANGITSTYGPPCQG